MNAHEILRDVHRIGRRLFGTVVACDEPEVRYGLRGGNLRVQTYTAYPALLPYLHWVDHRSSCWADTIPEIGGHIEAVIHNFIDGTLYFSTKPSELR